MITIKKVENKKDLRTFARFAARVLYKDCKLYVPSLYSDELAIMNPKKISVSPTARCAAFWRIRTEKL